MGEALVKTGDARRTWKKDPEGVRADILSVAISEFAAHGLSGARVDDIAARTSTSKRMLYYYFGDKEGLYRAALEGAYAEMRSDEDALNLWDMPPVEALRALVGFTFDHHSKAEPFVRLVMIENIHNGVHMAQVDEIAGTNSSAILLLDRIYRKGVAAGLYRAGLSALALHWQISAMCFFNVSNRATFSQLFGTAMFEEQGQADLRALVCETILRLVLVDPDRADRTAQAGPVALDPNLRPFLAAWDEKWSALPEGAAASERRAHFELIASDMRLPTPDDVDAEDVLWIKSPAGRVRVRLFRHGSDRIQPCLVYLHGGGWTQGSPETHWDITSRLADWCGMTVVSVDYALAPEHPFPDAFTQIRSVVEWVAANAADLAIDPDRIAIGGDDAGANLAAAMAVDLRDDGPGIVAQLLIYPVCDGDRTRPSYRENRDGPLLTGSVDAVGTVYCPDPGLHTDPRVAPLHAERHAGLPPAYIALASHDPFRDSGRAYADALRAAGVAVALDDGPGLIHGYLSAMACCPASMASLRAMARWLSRELGTSVAAKVP